MIKKVLFISIFNHWLSEQEADNCSVLCYSTAKDCNDLENYLKGEQKFLNFYQSLDTVAHIIYDDDTIILNTADNEFIEIIKNGLREIKSFKIEFPNINTIIESGYDRTDRIIVQNNSDIDFIKNMIKSNQLYIIDEMDYDEYIEDF